MANPDRKTFEAAATWYVQFQSQAPTAAERLAWQQWLNGDPSHQAAWNQMEQLQRSLGALPQDFTRRALSTTLIGHRPAPPWSANTTGRCRPRG